MERLSAGDRVLGLKGGWRSITRVSEHASPQDDPPHPRYAAPVRIVADAFDSGLPARDLFLAPGHRVYVDRVLVPIRLLINGATVQRTRAYGTRYFRIELERHDILLAEGLPVETFLTPDEAVSRTGAADRRPGEGVVCARTVAGAICSERSAIPSICVPRDCSSAAARSSSRASMGRDCRTRRT